MSDIRLVHEPSSRCAILVFHGFGDTPQSLAPVVNGLFDRGYDVFAPVLPGHGLGVGEFISSGRKQWLTHARKEAASLLSLYDTVVFAGLSVGGALAAILASELPCSALILMAPFLGMPAHHRLAAATHLLWGWKAGVRPTVSPRSVLDPSQKAAQSSHGIYTGRLLFEIWRTAVLARKRLGKITAPTLIIQSRLDPRISQVVALRAYRALFAPQKSLVWLDRSGHVITLDYEREKVIAEAGRWLEAYAPL